uniref:Shikimate dehydrogenase n=1 Tax=Caldilinea aerophila TaxID=133453 RepID=A0A7C1JAR3_9CHLR
MHAYPIVAKTVPTFYFIGVTTRQSSIVKLFPRWMELLGRPEVVLEGVDHKIHDAPEAYRATVAQIKYDPLSLGALVTTHKMDIYAAAQDMFDFLDPYARLTRELSSISKREGRLEGHAKDPISVGLSLRAIIGSGYFGRTGGHVLCFGAGGSGIALLLHLISQKDKADRPERFILVDLLPARLEHAQRLVEQLHSDIAVECILNADPQRNDALMASLPSGSVVVNATGLGKDLPGSPITDQGVFPCNGVVWEFNYRGELLFLHQALRQQQTRHLRVEDGWLYFLHGWSQVIAQVLHIELSDELFARLEAAATAMR